MARIWLTGGSGLVGRHVRAHPRANDHEILAPTRKELDLRDAEAVDAWVARNRPDVVIHAAGKVGGIAANIAAPVSFLDENLSMGRNVIMAACAAGIPRLINLSSSCIYPKDGVNPLTEEQVLAGPLEPTNEGYALAKIVAMRLCSYVSREHPDLHYKTLIPCNLYGPWDDFSPERSHLLPAIIAKIHAARAKGETTVEIWGDGTVRREFMFVEDAADGIWEAVTRFDELPDVMNLGVGRDYTVNEYYAEAARVIGWNGRFVHDLSRPVGMTRKLVDISRQQEFGWAPRHSLAEGIRKTYAYFLEHCV